MLLKFFELEGRFQRSFSTVPGPAHTFKHMKTRRSLAALVLSIAAAAALSLGLAQSASATSFVSIRNLDSGLCLQPSEPDTTSIGVQLAQEPCTGQDKQQWTAVPLGSGKYQFVNKATGGCMDAHGPFANGTPVDTWFCGNISNQKWGLATTVPTTVPTKMLIGGQCLDVPTGFPAPGQRIQISTCIAGHRAQAWFAS